MLFPKCIAPLALLLAAASVSAQSIAKTRCSNGQAAQTADAAKASITTSSACNVGDSTCVGDLFGQCVSGKFVTTACAGGLKCQILPLVNKSGTSVACTTDADKTARIADSLGNCNGGGAAAPSAPAPQAPAAPAAPATPPPAAPASGSGGIAQTRCSNGQAAQTADAAKASITTSSACNVGDSTCVGDLFGQCVSGKFVTTACAGGLKCQILPLVNKAGTSVACTTDADKTARIADSLGNCNGGGAAAPSAPAPQTPAAPATPPPAAPASGSGASGAGNKKGTQFITGPCSSDADCASACCGFKSGKCAGPVIAQERDGGCGFGDAKPNDTAARIFRGQSPA
ncbi:hypothetical protein HDU87_002406 [Geranomyces variabilis]|uniref:Uncharacterized protein n=1 Tax=Geranomyces variabilis TaxID=109894 RepID=A0AAD5TR68_9FUNG|nr:hypothetical protein HDU87_002406 [Geranomyces variabilis]